MPTYHDQGIEFGETLAAAECLPDEYVMRSHLRTDLAQLMTVLTPRQREVLKLRFGLMDGNALSQSAIANRLQISSERVRQLEQQALKKLRQHQTMIQDYLTSTYAEAS